jgi:hypothetical protein
VARRADTPETAASCSAAFSPCAYQSVMPSGPVDVSYGQPLENDILALQRDCPQGTILGTQWRNGG